MNKHKLRIENELARLGFLKVEADFWAWFRFCPERTITRLDVALGSTVTATYTKGDNGKYVWWMALSHAPYKKLQIDRPDDVKPALDLLTGV